MRSFLLLSSLLLLGLVACDPAEPAPSVETRPAEIVKGAVDPARQGEPVTPVATTKRDDTIAAGIERLKESRALGEAHAAGTLGDRLVVGEMLLIDGRAPAATDKSQFFLLDGPPPATSPTLTSLRELKRADGSRVPHTLQGGEDSGRPAVFRDVKPGTYTACVVLSPPPSAARLAYLAEAEAAYKAEHGEQQDAAKLMAVADKVQAETGDKPEKLERDPLPVRCKQVVVGADAVSRVVVIEP